MDAHFHLAAQFQIGNQQHIQGVIHCAFYGILHRDHAVIACARNDFPKHLVDTAQQLQPDRLSEMLQGSSLREGPLRSQAGDIQRRLQGQAGRHDFPDQAYYFPVRHGALVQGFHPVQHPGFPLGVVHILLFYIRNVQRQARALVEQLDQPLVQRIDLTSQVIQL